MRAIPRLRLLILCLALTSCCAGGGSHVRLLLKGTAPSALSGTGADDAAVAAALTLLMQERVYNTGSYMSWGGCTGGHDASKIVPGDVDTSRIGEQQVIGTGVRQSGRYIMEFDLPEGHLRIESDFNTTQGLIYEIKKQRAPDTSYSTVISDCTFSGTLDGKPVDLTFQQEIRATKNEGYPIGY